ncbi:MAG: hypothetical protein ACJAZO_002678 [Myxococcota bacterium]
MEFTVRRSFPLLFWLLPSVALASPVLSHQARVLNVTGQPVNGAVTLQVALFDAEDSVSAFFNQDTSTIAQNGYVAVLLGADDTNPLDAVDLADGDTWIQYSVNGMTMGTRQQLASVPHAAAADAVIGGIVDASVLSIGGTPFVESAGVISGDLLVDGSLRSTGIQLPYTVTIDGRSWLDETKVQLNGANPVLNANGTLNTGTSFTGSSGYILIPLVSAGVLPNERMSVQVSWRRICRTSDCDTITRLQDGNGVGWMVASYDNSAGQSPIANVDGSEGVDYDGVGQPTLVYVDALIGGGQATTLSRRIRLDRSRTDTWVSTQIADPSSGLLLRVGRGDPGEGYTEGFIEVTLDRAR